LGVSTIQYYVSPEHRIDGAPNSYKDQWSASARWNLRWGNNLGIRASTILPAPTLSAPGEPNSEPDQDGSWCFHRSTTSIHFAAPDFRTFQSITSLIRQSAGPTNTYKPQINGSHFLCQPMVTIHSGTLGFGVLDV
jgi:hypothetical protein